MYNKDILLYGGEKGSYGNECIQRNPPLAVGWRDQSTAGGEATRDHTEYREKVLER